MSCSRVGLEDPYLEAGGPKARACEAAGFGTAAGPSPGGAPAPKASASALPETGGRGSVVALSALVLLVGAGLLAFGVARSDA